VRTIAMENEQKRRSESQHRVNNVALKTASNPWSSLESAVAYYRVRFCVTTLLLHFGLTGSRQRRRWLPGDDPA
jgi:hypothetical protein